MSDSQQHTTLQRATSRNLAPTTSHLALSQQPEPGRINITIPVPQSAARAGHDTTTAQDSSRESLDEDIAKATDGTTIDSANSTADENPDSTGLATIKPLPEDHDTPFSPPTDPVDSTTGELEHREHDGGLDPAHPATDSATNIDPHEEYDEGQSGAAEATEPNAGDAVVGYDPRRDQRNHAA